MPRPAAPHRAPAPAVAADAPPQPVDASMTRSGLFDAPPETDGQFNPNMSGEFSTIDMVNRLEPVGFRWIESSPAEQEFLGWTLAELRQKSFLDVVHPGRSRACRADPARSARAGRGAGLDRASAHGRTASCAPSRSTSGLATGRPPPSATFAAI